MKKILTLLAIALAALTSCKPEEEEISPSEVYLNVYYDDIVFPSDGGEDSFEIESNGEWVITNDADWLTVEPSEGKGNGLITLTASASDVYDDRNTVITVRAGDKTETFTVTQKYAEALLVTKNKFDIPQEGGEFTVEVQSNISYDVLIDEDSQSWITEVPSSKALSTYTHTFSVADNPDTTKRDGCIEIIGSNGKTETVNVYQAQKDELVLSKSVETVPAKGGEVRVQLRSNVDYEVIVPEDVDWVEQLQSDKADELVFNVKLNSSDRNREAKITIKDKNSDLSQVFRIIQTVGRIILEENYFEIGAKGGIVELNLSTDIDIKVVIPDNIDWITVVQTKSLEAKTIILDIEPNDKEEERVAIITIQDINSPLSQNVEIKQSPYGYYVGDISAETEEDLIAIREAGYKIIDGNAYFNVTTLSQLDNIIEEITGNLTIGYDVSSLDGLYGLKHVGGDLLENSSNNGLKSFEGLNNLTSIQGNFSTANVSLKSLTSLETIGGDFDVSWVESFEGLENLKSIGGCLEMRHITSCRGLTKINTLSEVKANYVESFEGLENLNIIQGDFYLVNCDIIDFTGLSNLQNIGGNFMLYATSMSFGKLVSFNGLNKLQAIGKNFEIKYISENVAGKYVNTFYSLESFEGLTNLTKVGGNFEISTNAHAGEFLSNLRSFKGLDNLKEVDGHFLINVDNRGNYGSLGKLSFAEGPQKLSLVGGDFIVSNNYYNVISSMEGFSSLKTIKGNFSIDYIESFLGLDNLSTIGGNLTIRNSETSSIDGLIGLETIYGNLSIYKTSITAITKINKLQKVGGDISIDCNFDLEDISGFSGLTNCTNISITSSPKLYNFQPLETAAKNMTGTWYVHGCGYNPTKYQMLNGESKPQE